FLDSDDGRPLRILAEYLQPLHAFRREGVEETVVFFGSARLREDGPLGRYYAEARELARRLTEWSLSLQRDPVPFVVCTGGGRGRTDDRAQYRLASRAAAESVYLARSWLRVSLLLHAQAVVRAPRVRDGGLSRRVRHARRSLRDPDALADAQALAAHPRAA